MDGLALGRRGLGDAISRVEDAGRDHDAAQIAASEAIMWIAALDEVIHGKSHDGLLRAVRYVRNCALHDLAGPLALEGLAVAFTYDAGISYNSGDVTYNGASLGDDLRWASLEQLPSECRGRHGQQEYREHLEGKPVTQTLRHAQELLGG